MKASVSTLFVVSLLVCGDSSAVAQDLKRSAQMQVLGRQIGHWQTRATIRPSRTDAKGATVAGEASGDWILGGRFVRMQEHVDSAAGRTDYQILMTYDNRMKSYRRWVFGSDGVIVEAKGKWDAHANTMIWTAVGLPDNVTITVKAVLTSNGFTEQLFGRYTTAM